MSWQQEKVPATYASAPVAQSTPVKKDKCFSCGKDGHWAVECPSKRSRSFSPPNPSSTPNRSVSVGDGQGSSGSGIVCQCGAGVCKSAVAKTNGKVYYKCPAESWKCCDFFKWRDDLHSSGIKQLEYPVCKCGAGKCVLGWEAATDRKYFKCRVPKGQGACSFKQWLDAPAVACRNSVTVEENYQLGTPQTLGKRANHPIFEEDYNSPRKRLRITELDGSPNSSDGRFSLNSTALYLSSDMKEGSVMSTMELGDDISPEEMTEIMKYDNILIEDDELSCKRLNTPELEEKTVGISTQLSLNSAVSLGTSNIKEIPTQIEIDLTQFDTDEDFINEVIAFESTISDAGERSEISYESQMDNLVETETTAAKSHEIVQLRQVNFQRRMDAAATDIPQEKHLSVMFGAQYLGWLSRLALASPQCYTLPLDKRWFSCIFPNFDPIYVPRGLGQFNDKPLTVSNSLVDKSLTVPQVSVVEDVSAIEEVPTIILKEPSALEGPSYLAEDENVVTAAILEAFGQAAMLIQTNFKTRLESMNPSSHESMAIEANTVFASLEHLKVDYRTFHQRVKDFIDAAASLTQIELSISSDRLLQDTIDRCNQEKFRFEQLLYERSTVTNSFTHSQERVQTLLNEAEEVRNKLMQIEKQVSLCRSESNILHIRLTELSEQINECENSLQSASREAEAARKSSLIKEAELSAAWDAFENAKFQLRDKAAS